MLVHKKKKKDKTEKKKKKTQMKFIIHITISFKNKASSSLQSFQAEHKYSCYHSVFKSNLDSFLFFHPGQYFRESLSIGDLPTPALQHT